MKKKRLLGISIVALCLIGVISISAVASPSVIEVMRNIGGIFESHHNDSDSDDSVFARGKSGGIITEDDIDQATDFYVAAGYDDSTAREMAITYMLERDALYQKAISEGYEVTDEEISSYLETLKATINNAVNKEEALALINEFDSEEEYWQYEFEVYRKNLPIEKYLDALKQEYLSQAVVPYSEKQVPNDILTDCNNYIESIKEDLVEEEQYEINE